MSDDDL